MNSHQKIESKSNQESHESFVGSFEKTLSEMTNIDEIELLFKKLQYLGFHFDPFQENIENECVQIMDQLGLADHFKNPYLATNILLRLLDKTEERINNLKQ